MSKILSRSEMCTVERFFDGQQTRCDPPSYHSKLILSHNALRDLLRRAVVFLSNPRQYTDPGLLNEIEEALA